VIGQSAYPGGWSSTIGLPALDNPARDAHRMVELLGRHGIEVISCDGNTPGCYDLDRARLLKALIQLELRAAGAELALVFFAGHGIATEEGNILTPVDAKLDCATGAVTHGAPIERIMAASQAARMKLVILDACRDNPLGDVCPGLKGKRLSFTHRGRCHGRVSCSSPRRSSASRHSTGCQAPTRQLPPPCLPPLRRAVPLTDPLRAEGALEQRRFPWQLRPLPDAVRAAEHTHGPKVKRVLKKY
jgi:hypothetical protein